MVLKIRMGEFKVSSKRKARYRVWDIFGEIVTGDGTTLPNLVYCRTCKQVYRFNGQQTSNLDRHKCNTEKNKGILFKILYFNKIRVSKMLLFYFLA